jgi:hypothetical protein
MKTIDNLRKYIPVYAISILLIASSFEAGAQNRHKNNGREKENDRKEYRQPDRHGQKITKNDWKDRKNEKWDHGDYTRNDNRKEYQPKYYKGNKHSDPDFFTHPRYGRVYTRFDHNPLVFKHQHGDYYYFGNNFYRYHQGIGYCVVEPPRNIYFRHLPDDCNKVRIDGRVFFRHGDLFFQLSPRGYVIVPSPIEIRFSARF